MEKPWGHIAKLRHLIVLGHRASFMIKFVLAALQLVKFDVQSVTNERPCPCPDLHCQHAGASRCLTDSQIKGLTIVNNL